MPNDHDNSRVKQVIGLQTVLSRLPSVTRFDTQEHCESDALAHAIDDLDASFRAFSQNIVPRLLREGLDSESVQDILLEIREELRHVVYHIRDCKTFKDILGE